MDANFYLEYKQQLAFPPSVNESASLPDQVSGSEAVVLVIVGVEAEQPADLSG